MSKREHNPDDLEAIGSLLIENADLRAALDDAILERDKALALLEAGGR